MNAALASDTERTAAPQKNYALVTALHATFVAPFDPCTGSCVSTAEKERAKAGPAPSGPVYRVSTTVSELTRKAVLSASAKEMRWNRQKRSDWSALLPSREEAIKTWAESIPKGAFRPDDAADVFAKYWLFSWVYGVGIASNEVTDEQVAGVRAQAHRLFATDPAYSMLSENQCQLLAEKMILVQRLYTVAFFFAVVTNHDGTDKDKISALMETIKTTFEQEFGVSLSKLALTSNQGFAIEIAEPATGNSPTQNQPLQSPQNLATKAEHDVAVADQALQRAKLDQSSVRADRVCDRLALNKGAADDKAAIGQYWASVLSDIDILIKKYPRHATYLRDLQRNAARVSTQIDAAQFRKQCIETTDEGG